MKQGRKVITKTGPEIKKKKQGAIKENDLKREKCTLKGNRPERAKAQGTLDKVAAGVISEGGSGTEPISC